jgi:hypothetical protein
VGWIVISSPFGVLVWSTGKVACLSQWPCLGVGHCDWLATCGVSWGFRRMLDVLTPCVEPLDAVWVGEQWGWVLTFPPLPVRDFPWCYVEASGGSATVIVYGPKQECTVTT